MNVNIFITGECIGLWPPKPNFGDNVIEVKVKDTTETTLPIPYDQPLVSLFKLDNQVSVLA